MLNTRSVGTPLATLAAGAMIAAAIAVSAGSNPAPQQGAAPAPQTIEDPPIGTVAAFFGDPATLVLTDWQLCDGTVLRPDADPNLRLRLGGNEAHTPDFAKKVLYGAGNGLAVNAPFGTRNHTHEVPAHTHAIDPQSVTVHGHGDTGEGGGTVAAGSGKGATAAAPSHTHEVDLESSGTLPAHSTNRNAEGTLTLSSEHYPPGIGVNWIIRVR